MALWPFWSFGPEWASFDPTPGGVQWTDELTALGTPIVIVLTAIFALRQLRESEKSRYAALAADLTRRWDEPLMIASRKAMATHSREEIRDMIAAAFEDGTTPEEADTFYTLQALPNFIETMAAIEDSFGLTLAFVDRLWGSAIISSWERWSVTAEWVREQPNGENAFRNFERLADDLRKLRAGRGEGGGQTASQAAQA